MPRVAMSKIQKFRSGRVVSAMSGSKVLAQVSTIGSLLEAWACFTRVPTPAFLHKGDALLVVTCMRWLEILTMPRTG